MASEAKQGVSVLRPTEQKDTPELGRLFLKSWGEHPRELVLDKEHNEVGIVLEQPDGQIQMAVLGEPMIFLPATLIANSDGPVTEAERDNLFLLVDELERTARNRGIRGVALWVPKRLEPLAQHLIGRGFVDDFGAKLYFNLYSRPSAEQQGKPS
jgi:hypothetical protein